jgi:hypothetical protein
VQLLQALEGRSHSWAAVSVLDADVTMRFWETRLLPFELLLPPTCFSARLVSASWLVAFVHFVRGPGIIISDHSVASLPKRAFLCLQTRGSKALSCEHAPSATKVRYCRKRGAYLRITDRASLGVGD